MGREGGVGVGREGMRWGGRDGGGEGGWWEGER